MKDLIIHKQNGEILNKPAVRKFYDSLKDGKHLVSHKDISRRSLKQNDYLHMMFGMVQEGLFDAGYSDVKTKEDAKFVCKDLFLYKWIENGLGGKIKVHRRTRDLSKEEMSLFIDDVIRWSAEYLNVVIPMPNQPFELFKAA